MILESKNIPYLPVYIFDNDLNVYLLELNKGPDMTSKNDKDYNFHIMIYL